MLKIRDIVKVKTLEEAYEMNQKRTSRILGGMLWMRMSNATIQTGIDLSDLGLDQIEETDEEFRIGCMTTLRDLELHESLNAYSQDLAKRAVQDIVGVQFRNMATVGGSIFGRFGFSDVLTAFLVLDSYVELYMGGILPLQEFAERKRDNDILVRIIVKKTKGCFSYKTYRNTKTDFPVLTVAAAKCDERWKIAVGARPAKAKLICVEKFTEESVQEATDQFTFGSNIRASAEYRQHLSNILIKRAWKEIASKEEA